MPELAAHSQAPGQGVRAHISISSVVSGQCVVFVHCMQKIKGGAGTKD